MPLATVNQDRRGDITVRFASARLRGRIRKHTGRKYSSIFLQGDAGLAFLGGLPGRARREVDEGWAPVVRLTWEVVAALVGDDFNPGGAS